MKHLGLIAFACFCLVLVAAIISHTSVLLKQQEIERTKIEQREETIRNEEDNQFWQKIVPWGEYEDEKEE